MKIVPILIAAALLAFGATANAQTNTVGLVYNATTFAVQGWTNTNALTFSNNVTVQGSFTAGDLRALNFYGVEGEDIVNLVHSSENSGFSAGEFEGSFDPSNTNQTAMVFAFNGEVVLDAGSGLISAVSPIRFYGDNALTNAFLTRSNFFGAPGISTNIQVVKVGGATNTLVFTNGLLKEVTTP
jgi:hypothetical protein